VARPWGAQLRARPQQFVRVTSRVTMLAGGGPRLAVGRARVLLRSRHRLEWRSAWGRRTACSLAVATRARSLCRTQSRATRGTRGGVYELKRVGLDVVSETGRRTNSTSVFL